MNDSGLTHIDQHGRPAMVDVGAKQATPRTAVAQAVVVFPEAVFALLRDQNQHSSKGPIIDTAIIAGVMAGKRTHELIPFCHPLPLDNCKIEITPDDNASSLVIVATVGVTHKTGVEMEALTAASVAALTVYDMCKALSHDIVIKNVRLLGKTGGKTNFAREVQP